MFVDGISCNYYRIFLFMNMNNDYFQTSDLGLATILYSFGYPIDALDRSDNRRILFLFKRCKEIDEVIQQYWARELGVEPLAFLGALKDVKSRIYDVHEIE